jgi:hypothetical protein
MDAAHTAYLWIEQLLVPLALAGAVWQVLRRNARARAAGERLVALLAARAPHRLGGAWAQRRLALQAAAAAAAEVDSGCGSGCGRCGACPSPQSAAPSSRAASLSAQAQPVQWPRSSAVDAPR